MAGRKLSAVSPGRRGVIHDSSAHDASPGSSRPDVTKGTLEGDTPNEPQQCNCHGAALDDDGMPCDMVAIAEDVEGAEVDETQG